MNEIIIKNDKIKNMIYVIRGKEVILDSDLAKLYQVETKRINEAVKNNPIKFPERFSWILTKEEYDNLRSIFSTSRLNSYGGRRYNPRVFTEQGVAMLATILKSDMAAQVSIAIMDAFVAMRHFINDNEYILKNIININNELVNNKKCLLLHDKKIKELFSKFETKELTEKIYFNGQIYDAYSKLIDIMKEAQEELIIVDCYADKSVLDMIAKINIKVILIVKTDSLLEGIDIKKYNEQYHNLKIIYNDTFHDRYLIIEKKNIYHCGTSLNKAGCKTFSINKLEDEEVKISLINKLYTIN